MVALGAVKLHGHGRRDILRHPHELLVVPAACNVPLRVKDRAHAVQVADEVHLVAELHFFLHVHLVRNK